MKLVIFFVEVIVLFFKHERKLKKLVVSYSSAVTILFLRTKEGLNNALCLHFSIYISADFQVIAYV